MDVFTDIEVEQIVFMCGSQVGKTETINNCLGYLIEIDPGPTLIIHPSLEMADAWSKERLAPLIRDTPSLTPLVGDARAKSGENTIRHKDFPGGYIAITGANSPAGLAARPIRYLFADEVDRYSKSAGSEGDPISLAVKRTQTFWNKKKVYDSTPTDKGFSRIETLFNASDQRHYYVPCPDCGHMQTLKFGGPDADFGFKWNSPNGVHDYNSVWYMCAQKQCRIEERDKNRMLTLGQWRPHAAFTGTAGFHISGLYSPWKTYHDLIKEFIDEKKLPETYKTWYNTILALPYEVKGDQPETDPLMARREDYGETIPDGVLLIVAGVDTQNNRLVVRIQGYGHDWEQWLLDYFDIPGDPALPDVWNHLDKVLERTFITGDGVELRIVSALIDSGGHRTNSVYDYVTKESEKRQKRLIYASKGHAKMGMPVIRAPKAKNKEGVWLHMIGTDTTKEIIYAHIDLQYPGPGYCHFPFKGFNSKRPIELDFFKEQTSEKMVMRYDKTGHPIQVWEVVHKRNEALDCDVLCYAAAKNLQPVFTELAGEIQNVKKKQAGQPVKETPKQQRKRRRVISKGIGGR